MAIPTLHGRQLVERRDLAVLRREQALAVGKLIARHAQIELVDAKVGVVRVAGHDQRIVSAPQQAAPLAGTAKHLIEGVVRPSKFKLLVN